VMQGLDLLWGGVIRTFEVDLLAPSLVIALEVVEARVVRSHRLTLAGLRELRLVREPPQDWRYAELTSIEASQEGAGWRVRMELWSSRAVVEALCGSVVLEALEAARAADQ
jgi:hypothetical protein